MAGSDPASVVRAASKLKRVQVWAVAEGGAGRLMLRVGAPRLSVARSRSLSLSLSPFRPLPFSPHSCLSPCISPSPSLPVSVPFPHSLIHGAARRAILRGHIACRGLWLVTAPSPKTVNPFSVRRPSRPVGGFGAILALPRRMPLAARRRRDCLRATAATRNSGVAPGRGTWGAR